MELCILSSFTDLVEEVAVHIGNSDVRPSSVNQQKLCQEPELTKGIISGHSSL